MDHSARHLAGRDRPARITAKTEYAVRAVVHLAGEQAETWVKAEEISRSHGIPLKFLLNILGELRQAALVASRRGADGGYRLARPPGQISLAEVIHAIGGPPVSDRADRIGRARGGDDPLDRVWAAVEANLEEFFDGIRLADLASPGGQGHGQPLGSSDSPMR